jgi:6,7-dimethyl-8-ribityllumazine synthase
VAKTPSATRPDGHGLRVVVLRATFNAGVVAGLTQGAVQALREMGTAAGSITTVDVPGAFELPLAARAAASSGRFDAVVALGAVIRGETDHYEHIAREAAAGLAAASRETGVPVGFGVLTVADEGQARARSEPGPGNKGAEAARAAVAMVQVLRGLRPQRRRATPPAGRSAKRPPRTASRRGAR